MKKILAIAIVAIMTVALSLTAFAALPHTSADEIYKDDGSTNIAPSAGGNNIENTDLGDISDKVESTIYFWGWYAADQGIVEYGYKYGDKVVLGSPKFEGGDKDVIAVQAAGLGGGDGSESVRFKIATPVVKGENVKATAVAKLADGSVVDIWTITYTSNKGVDISTIGADDQQGGGTVKVELTKNNQSQVEAEEKDGKIICTTNAGANDPWVSIPLDNIDTSVYKYITVTYTATKEIGSNNTYLMDTSVNPGYSGTGGTWCGHGMAGTADGAKHTKTYSIETDFPTMAGTTLTGIRFTACGEEGGVFTIESIEFSATDPAAQGNPGTADAAVIAIAAVACIALAGVVVAKKVK